MDNDTNIKVDELGKDTETQVSQIIMKVFLLGMIVGKGQLQDDANASGSPMAQVLAQLQGQFDQLLPGSKQGSEAQAYAGFQKNMLNNMLFNISKNEKKKEESKIPNENLTPNDKRLNDQHDVIVRQMMDSLEDEMKQTAANIVKDTKIFKK